MTLIKKNNIYVWRPIVFPFGHKLVGVIVASTDPCDERPFFFARTDFSEFGSAKEYFEEAYETNVIKRLTGCFPVDICPIWECKFVKLGPFLIVKQEPEKFTSSSKSIAIELAKVKAFALCNNYQRDTNISVYTRG